MPRRTCAAVLAAALALLAGSCRATTPPAASSSPAPGGVLRVGIPELGSLDPVKASWRGALEVQDQIFDSLTAVDPVTNELRPAAAAYWTRSKDGLTWTFRIAPGATFHDGRAVTAGDFKFAFDRIAAKGAAADAAFALQSVKGFREAHDLGTAKTLSGVSVKSDIALLITTTRPYAELPFALSHPRLGPVERSAYAASAAGLESTPIGNGPFRVAGVSIGQRAELVRYDAYAGTAPLLDGIRFEVAKTADEGWRAFLAGELDIADVPPSVVGDAAAGRVLGREGFSPLWATLAFGPNLTLTKYAKPEVRRALSLAIDREAIARTIYNDTREPATGIIPAGVRGYSAGACSVCEFDRARAKRLLDAAFGKTIPPITIDHLNDSSSRAVARAIGDDLGSVGIKVRLRPHSRAAYVQFLQQGKQDLAQLGWLADVSTPDGFLAEQLRTGSPNNQTGFSDARFDSLIDQARAQRDEARRLALYRGAEARALSLMPMIPIVFFRNRVAVAERVRGFQLTGAGVFDGAAVWLAD